MTARAPIHRFTVDDYYRLAEAGVLPREQAGIELIEGQVIDMHPPRPHKYTVEDYYRMHEAGVLTEDDRVELIEGDIVEMAAIGSWHLAAVNRLNRILVTRLGQRGIVSVQNPLMIQPRSMPQPDLVVLEQSEDFYASGVPGPEDALLVIEVSDTTLDYDTQTKVPLYARAGVRELWIVNLNDESIEVFRGPKEGAFERQETYHRGGALTPLAFPDVTVRVDEAIGPSA